MAATTSNGNVEPGDLPLDEFVNNIGKTPKEEPTITFTASKGILETLGKSFDYEQESKYEAMMCRVYKDTYELFGGKLIWPEYHDLIMPEWEFEEFMDGFRTFLGNMDDNVIENTISLLLPDREHIDTDDILAVIDQGQASLVEKEYNEDADFPISDLTSLLSWLTNRGENMDLWKELVLAVYGFSSIDELEENNEIVEARASIVKKRVESSDLHRRARAYHHNVLSQKRAKIFKKAKNKSGRKSIYMTELVLTGAAAIFTVWLVSKFLKSH